MASLGMVLEGYSDDVIRYVTDPKTGIQRRSKWPPTVSEVVEACDEHMGYLQKVEKFRTWGQPDHDQKRIEKHEEPRPTLEELHAKYGKDWGLTIDDRPKDLKPQTMTKEQLSHHYQHFGLAFKPKPENGLMTASLNREKGWVS